MLVGCLTSQQHASVSQGRVCSDNCTCCHTEIEVADQTFHLTQSQYTDTGPTSPSTDPITPGAWQGSHWYQCLSHWYDSTPKKSRLKRDSNPGPSALEADALTTRPTRRLNDSQSGLDGRCLFDCQATGGTAPCVTVSLTLWLRRQRERKIRGSNPTCAGIVCGSSHTSDLKIGTPVATTPGAWRHRVSAETGWPVVSIL